MSKKKRKKQVDNKSNEFVRDWYKNEKVWLLNKSREVMDNIFLSNDLYFLHGREFEKINSRFIAEMPYMNYQKKIYIRYKDNYTPYKQVVYITVSNVIYQNLKSKYDIHGMQLHMCLNDIENLYLKNIIGDGISYQKAIECILKNPYCQDIAFVKRRNQVLKEIPNDITVLYPEARELKRHFVLHVGDTNTGKTYEAMESLANAKTGGYFAPLRLLAFEGQEKLISKGVDCSLLTGEEEDIHHGATHISCTVEMLDTSRFFDVIVVDEAQMISDESRGYAWTNAILGGYSPLIHVCMSENALSLVVKLIESCGDSYEVIEHKRNTQLIFEEDNFVFPRDVKENDALIVFSRNNVLTVAGELEANGWKPSVIYGSLPYNVRKEEMRRFYDKETNIIVATDAIGMGMNLPIQRVVFLQSAKFDGHSSRKLMVPEVKQIAGRAGRRGIFDNGFVNSAVDRDLIKDELFESYKPLTAAGIQIPDSLFSIPMKLSAILTEWMSIEDNGLYCKVSNEYRIEMCKWLEDNYPEFSKEAMWGFLCIAYDERNIKLVNTWKMIIGMIASGERIDTCFTFPDIDKMSLDECENYYKILDLYFSFSRLLGNEYNDFKLQLFEKKDELSLKIMQLLKKKKKGHEKKCKNCGKVLPFMFPYKICESCYDNVFRRQEQFFW